MRHPLDFDNPLDYVIGSLLGPVRNVAVLHFKVYEHVKSRNYSHEVVHKEMLVPVSGVSREWLEKESAQMSPESEIALSSRVHLPHGIAHIPMADCIGKFDLDDLAARAVTTDSALATCFGSRAHVAETGRSYHLYGDKLLTDEQWRESLGHLLLLNDDADQKFIDSRWVGRRLVVGYSGLRLTNKSKRHSSSGRPSFIGTLNLTSGTYHQRRLEG